MKFLKFILVVLGSIIIGLGVAIAINSGFGADPISLLWQGMTNIIPVTVGQASIILSIIMLVIVLVLDKKQIHLGTIINPLVVGMATDLFLYLNIKSYSIIINLILLIIGLILIGFGIALYSYANLGRGAYEALVFAIVNKFNFKLIYVRTTFDFIFLILGVLLGAKLSIGPILAFISLGYIIQRFIKIFENIELLKNINEN